MICPEEEEIRKDMLWKFYLLPIWNLYLDLVGILGRLEEGVPVHQVLTRGTFVEDDI